MGMLLRFSAKVPRAGQAAPDTRIEDAKVLLFTGVRYDRAPDSGQAKLAPAKPRAGRGRAKQ